MVDSEEKVPSISFALSASHSRQLEDGTFQVECQLHGQYANEELWEKIEKKLKAGFRIYGEEDFQGEVLTVLRDDYHKEKAEHEVTKQALKLEVARRIKADEELGRLKLLLGSLGAGLGRR